MKKIKFIHNSLAGTTRPIIGVRRTISEKLKNQNVEWDFVETDYAGHACELAAQAVKENYDVVVAVGGDGTVNEIGRTLLHSDTALGVVPAGSGNGLARSLGIPTSVHSAIDVVLQANIRKIDAGKLCDRCFFSMAGVGFDAVVGKIFNDLKVIRGPVPYVFIGLFEFLFYRPEKFTIYFDNSRIDVKALMVTVANAKGWGAGVVLSPFAEPDDGFFDLCIIHPIKFWRALLYTHRILVGKLHTIRQFERYKVKTFRIVRKKPGPFHVDGETFSGGKILDFKLEHRALNLIVPKP